MKEIKKAIQSDIQIKKFCGYGFLKNCKFFKPYLILYLLGNGLTLFHIGLLVTIREVVINIFEVPSGFLADYFGRKKILLISFTFYSLSFLVFFFSSTFLTASLAMVLFGLGSAFRSGTHKAMIYTYLEQKNWQEYKTFVYGRTRSFSLLGTALSSLIAMAIILNVPHSRFIFLASIIPFVLDFLLILSYPDSLDKADAKENTTMKDMLHETKNELVQNRSLQQLLFSESFFEGLFKALEDFIQPILSAIIIGSGILMFRSLNGEQNINIMLGITYAAINILNAVASRKAYILKNKFGSRPFLNISYCLLGLNILILALFTHQYNAVIFSFLILNILLNTRKPMFVHEIDTEISKQKRATMLSIASQLKSLGVAVIAPLTGYLADTYSMSTALFVCAAGVLVTFPIAWLKKRAA